MNNHIVILAICACKSMNEEIKCPSNACLYVFLYDL